MEYRTHCLLDIEPLSMVYWTLWYFDLHPTINIQNPCLAYFDPLLMVYWTHCLWILSPLVPTHSISNRLPIVYRTHYPWYIGPSLYFDPLPMVYWTSCLYIDPLPMIFWHLYPCYIETLTYCIFASPPTPCLWYFNPLSMVYLTPLNMKY